VVWPHHTSFPPIQNKCGTNWAKAVTYGSPYVQRYTFRPVESIGPAQQWTHHQCIVCCVYFWVSERLSEEYNLIPNTSENTSVVGEIRINE